MKIAVLGLGLMGAAIALRLKGQGLDVVGWNRSPDEGARAGAGQAWRRSARSGRPSSGRIFDPGPQRLPPPLPSVVFAPARTSASAAASWSADGHHCARPKPEHGEAGGGCRGRVLWRPRYWAACPRRGRAPHPHGGREAVIVRALPLGAQCAGPGPPPHRRRRPGCGPKARHEPADRGTHRQLLPQPGAGPCRGHRRGAVHGAVCAAVPSTRPPSTRSWTSIWPTTTARANFPLKHLLKDVRLCSAAWRSGTGMDTAMITTIEAACIRALEPGLRDQDYSALYEAMAPP